ncbi:MAG: hypothetical protein IT463_09380, partial [Planctomycetes bacterium]|nr:hypothetical protein [Planctomycetota bacterium]
MRMVSLLKSLLPLAVACAAMTFLAAPARADEAKAECKERKCAEAEKKPNPKEELE